MISELYLDSSEIYKIISRISFSDKGVSPGLGSLIKIKDGKPIFYCPQCNEKVTKDEIHSHCFQCGKKINIKDIFNSPTIGGFYCEECGKKYNITLGRSMSTIIEKAG